ncbi:MAG: Gfo/Idh/MocA family oxidoreductase [Candidatus Sumerlaeaceae bacterium]|nr:Gfo/Idh/MocA family oxidoreductase [Candidatus Sumerlaeaceae bacterium]
MPKLLAGVIGAGSIGDVHLTGYAAAKRDVAIHAICDINPRRLAEMGRKYGVPAARLYTDFKVMLQKEKLDVISVCTPNAFHFPAAAEALNHGAHTLIEKPMTLTLAEGRKLKALAAKSKAKTMVAFSHRFIGMNMAAKKLIGRGTIGKPFMIRVRYAHGGPYPGWAQGDWFYRKKLAGGGALLDMGIHAIDICQYLVGPVKNVSAIVRTLRKKIEVDDNAVLALDFSPAKCLGYIECGWTSGPGFGGIEIYGDRGSIVLELTGEPRIMRGVNRPDGSREILVEKIEVPAGPSHWPLQMESWVRHILGKKTVTGIPGIDEGLSSLAVALAAVESSKTGKQISVKI